GRGDGRYPNGGHTGAPARARGPRLHGRGLRRLPGPRWLRGRPDVERLDSRDKRRRAGYHEPEDGADRRVRRPGDDRCGAQGDRLLRLVLPGQLHEEGLAREVAGERLAQRPERARGEQGPVGEVAGGGPAPRGGAVEEGQGAPEGRGPAQGRERPGRRARRGREEGGRRRPGAARRPRAEREAPRLAM
ncbi:MAG: Ribonuclease HI, partial [uncultured Rubrobacteraceae bacterium]